MATLDMQGKIPQAKSEKVLASWAGHSAKKKERGLREDGWKREGKRGIYGEGGGGGVIKTNIQTICQDFYFCCNIIIVKKLTFRSEVQDKKMKFKGCVC